VLSRFHASGVDTRSVLEELVLALCDAHGLPRPRVNTVIEGRERDFCWPHARLVVEADSYTWHRSPSALDDDRERDVTLTLAGFRVLRFTWEQVTRRPRYVTAALLAALDDAYASPSDAKS
jgi:very-short-patch-repair endonuclease